MAVARGSYSQSSGLGEAPANDARNFRRVLECAYGTLTVASCSETVNTVAGVQELIRETFGDSTADSRNYFYFSGHGIYNGGSPAIVADDGQYLTAAELAEAFEGILGTNILVIDSCYSGGLISGSARSAQPDFSQDFTDALSQALERMPKSRSALTSSRFYILTGTAERELAWQENFYSPSDTAEEMGYFTSMIAFGCGIHAALAGEESGYRLGEIPADYDRNGAVSFDELREFLEKQCLISHVSMYPAYNNSTFIPGYTAAPKVILKKASVSYETGVPVVTVSYDASENFSLSYWSYGDSNMELGRFQALTGGTKERIESVISSWQIEDNIQRGNISSLPAGSGSFSFRPENLTSMFVALFQVNGQNFRYSLPYAVTAVNTSEMTKFTLSVGTSCLEANGTKEVRIRVDFGSASQETAAQPYVTLWILDQNGSVVRTLSDPEGDLVPVIQNSENGPYQYYLDYYWNGCNDAGTLVASGNYQIQAYVVFRGTGDSVTKTLQMIVKNETETVDPEPIQTEPAQTETTSQKPSDKESEQTKPTQTEAIQTETKQTETKQTEAKQTETKQTETKQTESAQTEPVPEETEPEAEALEIQSETGDAPVSTRPRSAKVPEATALRLTDGTKKITSLTIGVKESLTVGVLVLPKGAYDQTVTFKSSNSKILKVTQKGKITGIKAGKVKLQAQMANGVKTTVNVTVRKAPSKIKLTASAKTLKAGKTYQIRYRLPAGTASYQVTYTSSNKKVATVSAAGKVKALKKGVAVITVRTYNGKKAKIKVTVK